MMSKEHRQAAPPPALLEALKSSSDILCVSHVAPDGDAVGSLLGMGWLLRRLDKRPVLALQDGVPAEHRALPGADDVIDADSLEYERTVRNRTYDLIVCLDASSPDRMGTAYNASVHQHAALAVIDHHITNTRFGDINWVDPGCAATCQMLVILAEALDITLDGELAECLLTGLVTDTLAFRTSNTTADVLGAAMRLMQGGADLATITQRTVNRRPYSVIKLWGQVLPDVQLSDGVIWTCVTLADAERSGNSANEISLSSFLVTADEADISAVFTEKLENSVLGQAQVDASQNAAVTAVPAIECSFRAKPGFDVSEVALALGGGGHPAASGCTLPGPLADAIDKVIPALQAARRKGRRNNGADPDSA